MSPSESAGPVDEWLTLQSRLLREDDAQLVAALIDDAVQAEVPELGTDSDVRRALNMSTQGALRLVPATLGGDVTDVAANEDMRDLGRTLAMRRLDLSLLMRAYRVGQRVFWSELMRRVSESSLQSQDRADLLQQLWRRINLGMENWVEQVAAAYLEEDAKLVSGVLARRREYVEALLAGAPPQSRQATAVLKHNLAIHQTALILWFDPGSGDGALVQLEHSAVEVARQCGAPPPLTVPAGSRRLWAWIATPHEPAPGAFEGFAPAYPTVRVAVGRSELGATGFRRSHETALFAEQVSGVLNERHLVHYAEIELVHLLMQDSQGLRELVQRELGGLASAGRLTMKLRETLRVYLECGSSARAAENLSVHKNTILYRLQQVEELLGRRPDELGLNAAVALEVLDKLGTGWASKDT